jgi:hypothetical protein
MNILGIDLKVGDRIILTDGHTVKVSCDTFGCSTFCSGTMIAVEDDNGQKFNIHGMRDINKESTLKLYE